GRLLSRRFSQSASLPQSPPPTPPTPNKKTSTKLLSCRPLMLAVQASTSADTAKRVLNKKRRSHLLERLLDSWLSEIQLALRRRSAPTATPPKVNRISEAGSGVSTLPGGSTTVSVYP